MPRWMEALAALNPVAHAADALRGSVLGTGRPGDTLIALAAAAMLWCAVVVRPRPRRRAGSGATSGS
jgi:ABC-2 type transport system permease protein